jgi:hypothetical protein
MGVKVEQRSSGEIHFGTWLGMSHLDTREGLVDFDNHGICCCDLSDLDVEDLGCY